jgi:hypothetical protein
MDHSWLDHGTKTFISFAQHCSPSMWIPLHRSGWDWRVACTILSTIVAETHFCRPVPKSLYAGWSDSFWFTFGLVVILHRNHVRRRFWGNRIMLPPLLNWKRLDTSAVLTSQCVKATDSSNLKYGTSFALATHSTVEYMDWDLAATIYFSIPPPQCSHPVCRDSIPNYIRTIPNNK